MNSVTGENLPNSVADIAVVPDWEPQLRLISPITTRFSHLRPYWYRARSRWVLYDCLPGHLIPRDDTPVAPGFTAQECIAALEGKPPRDLEQWERCPFVSDVQHEMYRLHRVYARPFWVLQGDNGGHQVAFSPWQQNVLIAKQLPSEPPQIGALPPCPFDNRVVTHLQHLNRLHQFQDRIDALEKSGSVEAASAEMETIQREIRLAEAKFVEDQMTPVVDMSMSLARGVRSRSEHDDQLVHVRPGSAARAFDAYQRYLETGDYALSNLTGN